MTERTADRRSLTYTAVSLAPFVAIAASLFLLRGAPGLFASAILSLPWFAWRYDNQSGAFFVLSILVVIVLAVLVLLLMLMAIAH